MVMTDQTGLVERLLQSHKPAIRRRTLVGSLGEQPESPSAREAQAAWSSRCLHWTRQHGTSR
jgi:hypothetical protein